MKGLQKWPARFWAKVDQNGPVPKHAPHLGQCWTWKPHKRQSGYATIGMQKKSNYIHRVAYELSVGQIPAGLEIDHLCRVRHCVNPSHLEPVTKAENIRRGIAGQILAAKNLAKTHCPKGHPYAGDNLVVAGRRRACRECRRKATRERMRAQRAQQKGGR